MDLQNVKIGLRVKVTELGPVAGMMIKPHILENRKQGAVGVIHDWVPGHGGDVWWVIHDGPEGAEPVYAPYVFNEIEPL